MSTPGAAIFPGRLPPGAHKQGGQAGEGRPRSPCPGEDSGACRCRGTSMPPPGPRACRQPRPHPPRHHCFWGMHGGVRAQLPTRCSARGGRQAGGRRAGGTQSKQEDRRFHTPDSRQWTESGGADTGPTDQRAGVGAAFPPSRVRSALNQACGGTGEPRASGSVACPGSPAPTGRSCLPQVGRPARSGRARVHSRGARSAAPGEGLTGSAEGPRGHRRPIWASEPLPAPRLLGAGHRLAGGEKVVGAAASGGRRFGITGAGEGAWHSAAARGRGGRAANQNRGRGGRGRGRRPRPRSSRTSSKQSVWRGRGWGAVQQAVSARGSPRGT